ncbi:hypothetical protein OVS_00280 [Mycoplasma ovis str. Michigan]|uniref:Uncharacterized protein n=1 Tax=Mycoplasma ovis str. Michigan TaxID=1415773 RepID=A0ABN4BKW4_9MOLU|nr:hypothetical protein [Mycoplasma ovis]AHC39801.1 hypothetical protein OVS_00280 [Mycoplasma ovis str. Michigan]
MTSYSEEELLSKDEKLRKAKENKRKIENTFLSFHSASIFKQRLNNKVFFTKLFIQLCELYLSELQIALSSLEEHEREFLEDYYQYKLRHKDMFFSKANYYSCLNKYSDKFLKLFDYELFQECLNLLRKNIRFMIASYLIGE